MNDFNYINIWQVSPQLNGSDTWQTGVWYEIANVHIHKPENMEYNEREEISLVTPTPGQWLSK